MALEPDPRPEPTADPTITDVLADFAEIGWANSFAVRADGEIECRTCERSSHASTVLVDAARRLEGASDPDDMLLIYALTCPRCGARGALVLGFGPHASSDDQDVLMALPTTEQSLPVAPSNP